MSTTTLTTLTRLRLRATAPRALRLASAAPRYTRASSSSSTRDPDHPHLYYHPTPAASPTRIALSFLPAPPRTPASPSVLGTLPATPDAGLEDFVENRAFRPALHAAMKDGIAKGVSEGVAYEAAMRPGDGWMHITDERNLPPAGRIGDVEDLIATVFVQDGKIVPSTYEALPSYRLVTTKGVLTLPRGLDTHVVAALEAADATEAKESS